MSTYVMSDIHGCYDELRDMLRKINFSEDDQLIIAGDYIDRGGQNYEMLYWMENTSDNVLLLKGNHDAEFSYNINLLSMFIKSNNIKCDFNDLKSTKLIYGSTKEMLCENKSGILFDYYGTIDTLISDNNITLQKLMKWKSIIDNMPYLFKIKINNKRYIIVHAGYIQADKLKQTQYSSIEDFYLYARDEAYKYGGATGITVIAGHTPTLSKDNISYNNGLVYKKVDDRNQCVFYNIDCGCAYKEKQPNANLACIRLDDEKVFYITGERVR